MPSKYFYCPNQQLYPIFHTYKSIAEAITRTERAPSHDLDETHSRNMFWLGIYFLKWPSLPRPIVGKFNEEENGASASGETTVERTPINLFQPNLLHGLQPRKVTLRSLAFNQQNLLKKRIFFEKWKHSPDRLVNGPEQFTYPTFSEN